MALDTEDDRRAAMLIMPWLMLPVPDGSGADTDNQRMMVAGVYSGNDPADYLEFSSLGDL